MSDPQERPRRTRAERRRQVLAQARRLFAQQGYAATDPAQVAAAAKVREAVFARDYPDKAALFRDLLDDLADATLRAWRDETAELADPHARLQALADRCVGAAKHQAVAFRAVSRAVGEGDEEALACVRAFALEWEGFLAGLIAQGQQAGFFRRSLDPRVGAWQLIHAALAAALTRPLAMPSHAQEGYAAQAIECALHCLLKTDV